jgi:hypothetical protein
MAKLPHLIDKVLNGIIFNTNNVIAILIFIRFKLSILKFKSMNNNRL